MRIIIFIITTMLPLATFAGSVGELLWNSGEARKTTILQTKQGKVWMFPNVPLEGKFKANATPIGIIDSGVNATHSQLGGYIKEVKDFTGEGTTDELGHGTAVALIAVFGLGISEPPFSIISAKVVDRDGKIQEQHVIDAINWMVNKNVSVINLSLGFSGTRDEHKELCDTISKHSGTMFVAAAGNSGANHSMYPAACQLDNLLPVGATDASGMPADYSGRGEIYAPGGWFFQKEWKYYYDQAQVHARSKNFVEARLRYQKSISVEDNAESHFQIGLIELAENNISSAISQFKVAIQIKPDLAEAHDMLGTAFFLERKYQEAKLYLLDAIDLYPDGEATRYVRARAYYNLGQTFLKLGEHDQAKLQFLKVKQLNPDYPNIGLIINAIQKSQ